MSLFSERPMEEGGDDKRAKKLEAARKKLKTYRASRSSITSSQSSRSGGGSPTKLSISKPLSRRPADPSVPSLPPSRRGSGSTPHSRTPSNSAPLGDSNAGNFSPSPRRPSKGKERAVDANPKPDLPTSHRRKGSRVSHGRNGSLAARASVIGVFDIPPVPFTFGGEPSVTNGGRLDMPHEIITTPATPLPDTVDLDPLSLPNHSYNMSGDGSSEEDLEATRSRLSSFSFGTKPPPDAPLRRMARTPSPNGNQQPLPPSMALRMHDLGNFNKLPSPLSSPSSSHSAPSNLHRLSQTPSRPPSLLFTEPSPLPGSPSPADKASCPTTPPAVSRVKRHSHSRSSSISLPNLKLAGARPVSLGVPTSPSFSTSPSSPSPLTSPSFDRSRSAPNNGTARLKFEPSGRGAEADKEKEEYRRQALAKLTAASSPAQSQTPITQDQEIALPELDDADDESSTASSNRPESGIWGSGSSGWGRPNSLTLQGGATATASPTPFWAVADATAVAVGNERWSGGSGFGFGIKDEGLGFGLDLGSVKRGSLTSGLSVLAEVEEVEELEENDTSGPPETTASLTGVTDVESTPVHIQSTPLAMSQTLENSQTGSSSTAPTPTPSTNRLRGFRLSSSASSTPARAEDRAQPKNTTPSSISPTKGYGAIGRGRPKPLSNLVNTNQISSSPLTSSTIASAPLVTPTTGTPSTRRRGRGSSISYRKDHDESISTTSANASTSSRDWQYDHKSMSPFTSTSSLEVTSPTILNLGGFGSPTWDAAPLRNANRPCPRPKSMASQAAEAGANRVLSNVVEEDGDWPSDASLSLQSGNKLALDDEDEGAEKSSCHRVIDSVVFRDHTLELEMERDALREDVEGWRERCRNLEDNLEKEKKESGVLRERVRKLGDRLLTISTAQPPDTTTLDDRAMVQMRDQFFQLTASLERERREKEDALKRIEAMQAFMVARGVELSQFSPPSPPPSSAVGGWSFAQSAQSAAKMVPAKISPVIPASASRSADPFLSSNPPHFQVLPQQDPNLHRMKAWGFPSPADAPLPSPKIASSKRDSFFGLSAMLRKRDSVPLSHDQECLGVDLPPIILPAIQSSYAPPKAVSTPRAVSDPYRQAQTSKASPGDSDPQRSVSLPLSTGSSASTSAFSFISGYWRSKSSGPASNASPTSASTPGSNRSGSSCRRSPPHFEPQDLERTMTLSPPSATDLQNSCHCCRGPVIDL